MFALCLTTFQTSQAQSNQDDLCGGITRLIDASKTGFTSILGDVMKKEDRSYISQVELSGWGDGFVHPEYADGPFVLYVSLGGDDLSEIKKRYGVWRSKLKACLRGWKHSESSSAEEVASVFRQDVEGPTVQLDYNIEPSKIGDTKYDLYLTFNAPLSVIEKNFCDEISTLLNASRGGFASIVGAVDDEKRGVYKSTLKLSGWGTGWVYPNEDEPNVLYIILGSNRIAEVKSKYNRWVTKLTACLPAWKRTVAASREEVKSVFRTSSEGARIELEYNVTPSTVADTKYDLYLSVSTPRVVQKASP